MDNDHTPITEIKPSTPPAAPESGIQPAIPAAEGPEGPESTWSQASPLAPPGTAAAQEGQFMQLAAFGTRFWAFVIDLAVIGLLNALLANLLGIAGGATEWYENYCTTNFVFLGITGSLYFVLMTRFYRQTLGKMMMGISVVKKSGPELDWTTVIFRELIGRTLSQLCGSWLGYLVGLFTPRHVTIHDLLADTYVVKEQFSLERGFVKIPGK